MEIQISNMKTQKSENISELIKAVNKVMLAVDGVEKNSTIGEGRSAYKGTSDQDVKIAFKNAMAENGLAIFVVDIEEITDINRWEETQKYQNGTEVIKQKKEVFTKVNITYLLAHTSEQWIETKGIGYGIDTQDKSAGKSTTYSLKYNLLYQFLTPVGDIDDTDKTHSAELPVAPTTHQQPSEELVKDSKEWKQIVDGIGSGTIKNLKQINLPFSEELGKELKKLIHDKLPRLSKETDEWNTAIKYINEGKLTELSQLSSKFKISKALGAELQKEIDNFQNQKIVDEQLAKEKAQEEAQKNKGQQTSVESKPEDTANRLPNLTEDKFKEALNLTDKKEITNILNTHRMSQQQRDTLLKKLK